MSNVFGQIGEEEIKLSPSADNMILYIENPKHTHTHTHTHTHHTHTLKILLELINSEKLQGTKATHKSVVFLSTINEQYKKEIEKTIAFLMTSKRIKYLGINLTKEAKCLYTENYERKKLKI